MPALIRLALRTLGLFVVSLCAATAYAAPAVLQRGYTPGVINANSAESLLTPANVTEAAFGRIFSLPVDGRIYAQPLYVPGVAIPNQGTHNVLYVATMNDSIFAFDADTPGAPLWSVNYATLLGATPVPIVNFVGTDSFNIAGPVGIESTPVIDLTTQTMYFVTNTLESGNIVFRLHAVDITTGAEKLGAPVVIQGTFSAAGKTLTFTPSLQNQRLSLTIAKNQIIIGFGSHEDYYQYYGWLMAYDKTSLAQTGIFNPTPTDDHGGAFWQTGRPPVVDAAGYVYVFVANSFLASGSTSTWDGINNFTESALKLDPGQALKLIDYFTPANYQTLDNNDQDFSSSGPALIPGTTTLVGGGKFGTIYLLNTQKMGQLQANDAGAVQSFPGAAGEIRGGFAYWSRSASAGGPLAFNWAANDALKAFSFNGTTLVTTPVAQYTPPINLYPGGELTLSSNGDTQGIIWALINGQGDADHRVPPGILVAVNASTLSPLWSSTTNAARDDFGLLAKWVPPLVVNGKVYVATSSNQVVAYGELPASGSTVTAWPANQTALGGTAAVVLSALSAAGTAQTATWSVSGLPAGASGSFVTDSQGQTVLQITASATTPAGSYLVLATATVNGTQSSQPVYVQIGPSSNSVAVAATADSSYPSNPPADAIDGNPATFWHTLYGSSIPGYPHEITIDLGAVMPVNGVSYLTRQDGCSNGMILQYEVHLSSDGVNFPEVTGGSFDFGPEWHDFNCSGVSFLLPKRQTVAFPTTSARYLELVALGSVTDVDPWASAAEVQVFTPKAAAPAPSFTLAAAANPLTLAQNSGATDAISITPLNGFSGSVSLSISGLPAGVIGTFSGNVLNVTAPLSTSLGSYPLTITGTSGSTTATTALSLVITAAASFTLSPAATSVSLTAGGKGSDVITITPLNGFSSAVGLSASGWPAGASGTFAPASATTTSTLSITTTAAVAAGTYPLTITGTAPAGSNSASFTKTTTVNLVISAAATPGFTLKPAANPLTVAQNARGTDNITVTRVNGFSGAVTLSVTGLPAGVRSSFSGTELVISPRRSTPLGTYSLTVTGTSGTTTAHTTLTLVITAAR